MGAGQKIIEGLKDAVAGNFSRVTIDGQVWERRGREEWQPIETAPKDGTSLLLWDEDTGPVAGYWLDSGWNAGWVLVGGRFSVNPTYWMNRPAPPSR